MVTNPNDRQIGDMDKYVLDGRMFQYFFALVYMMDRRGAKDPDEAHEYLINLPQYELEVGEPAMSRPGYWWNQTTSHWEKIV